VISRVSRCLWREWPTAKLADALIGASADNRKDRLMAVSSYAISTIYQRRSTAAAALRMTSMTTSG